MATSLRSRSVRLIALACGLAATVFAWYQVGREADREARAEFTRRAELATTVLERRLQRYMDILYGVQAFMYHDDEPTRLEFHEYVNGLQIGRRFPGVRAVGLVRRVTDADRDAWVAGVRADSLLPIEAAQRFDITPPGRRDEYWVVDYPEPFRANTTALGFDIRTRETTRIAAERARDFGEPSATARYRLREETGSSYGLVLYLPVFRRIATHEG